MELPRFPDQGKVDPLPRSKLLVQLWFYSALLIIILIIIIITILILILIITILIIIIAVSVLTPSSLQNGAAFKLNWSRPEACKLTYLIPRVEYVHFMDFHSPRLFRQ
jgi:hypothetical protein